MYSKCCRKNPYIFVTVFIIFLYLFWDIIFTLLEDSSFGSNISKNVQVPENHKDRDCQCRELRKENHGTRIPRYCSDYSSFRGLNQKVIAFSLNGDEATQLLLGIQENLKYAKRFYPRYIVRIYHNMMAPLYSTESGKKICELYCSNPQFDLCNVHYIDKYRNLAEYDWSFWRFTPMIDPLVIEFHTRNLNARISEREKKAVDDWKADGATYHIMRDHPTHHFKILGGMFGMKHRNKNAIHAKNHFESMLLRSRRKWRTGIDHKMLARYVFPKAKYDMVAHDSYLCTKFSYSGNKAWPTKRIDGEYQNFVGSNKDDDIITLTNPGQCPIKCRPKEFEEWLLC